MIVQLPEIVKQAWKDRNGPLVLTTVDNTGVPNSIYAGMVNMTNDGRIAITDNYFDKTASNIKNGNRVAILFISNDRKAYQIKGTLEYFSEGPLFQEMLTWADSKYPRKGVVVMNPEQIYHGSERLL